MKLSPWLKTHWSSTATARKNSSDAVASSIRLEATSTSRTCRRVCSSRFWMNSSYRPCVGALFRLRTSGKGATCHDGSPLPGLLVFLPLIIDGIGGR